MVIMHIIEKKRKNKETLQPRFSLFIGAAEISRYHL